MSLAEVLSPPMAAMVTPAPHSGLPSVSSFCNRMSLLFVHATTALPSVVPADLRRGDEIAAARQLHTGRAPQLRSARIDFRRGDLGTGRAVIAECQQGVARRVDIEVVILR